MTHNCRGDVSIIESTIDFYLDSTTIASGGNNGLSHLARGTLDRAARRSDRNGRRITASTNHDPLLPCSSRLGYWNRYRLLNHHQSGRLHCPYTPKDGQFSNCALAGLWQRPLNTAEYWTRALFAHPLQQDYRWVYHAHPGYDID